MKSAGSYSVLTPPPVLKAATNSGRFAQFVGPKHHDCDACASNDQNAANHRHPVPVALPERKDTNPKDACGIAKVPLSTVSGQVLAKVQTYLHATYHDKTIPLRPLFETGLAMMEGGLKYGRHNYRAVGVRASVYFDAVWRHRAARMCGQEIDAESGLPHIVKEIAGLTVLADSMLQENWVDDRPPRALKNPKEATLFSWWEGQNDDPFSGAPVIIKEIGDLLVERESQCDPDENWIPALNVKAKALLEKHPEPVEAWTQLRVERASR